MPIYAYLSFSANIMSAMTGPSGQDAQGMTAKTGQGDRVAGDNSAGVGHRVGQHGQESRNRTASRDRTTGKGQRGKRPERTVRIYSQERTAVTRQPKQENRDRRAIKDSWDNTARIGKRAKKHQEHDSKYRTAGTGQLRRNSAGRTDMTGQTG